MVMTIFFIICGILFLGAIIFMLLHRRKTKHDEERNNPVAEENFEKDPGV